jgi:hypothetical protein
MQRLLLASAFLSILLVSCKLFSDKENGKQDPIARVYDKYLYKDELNSLIPKGTAANDSIEITTAYINNWVRQELLLKQAEDNLDEANRDFSKRIEQYRNSLIIYTYESELVKQKLDTVVPISEIEGYYNENQDNFHLRENIVLASYVILKKESGLATKMKSLLQSNREADKEKLQALCQENEADFRINDGTWISFAELARKIPLTVDDQQEFLSKNKFYEVKDSTALYFVAISAYKSKESISPLSFEIENIRTILLNKRKAVLLDQMEDDLIGDATKGNKYEIFKK